MTSLLKSLFGSTAQEYSTHQQNARQNNILDQYDSIYYNMLLQQHQQQQQAKTQYDLMNQTRISFPQMINGPTEENLQKYPALKEAWSEVERAYEEYRVIERLVGLR